MLLSKWNKYLLICNDVDGIEIANFEPKDVLIALSLQSRAQNRNENREKLRKHLTVSAKISSCDSGR